RPARARPSRADPPAGCGPGHRRHRAARLRQGHRGGPSGRGARFRAARGVGRWARGDRPLPGSPLPPAAPSPSLLIAPPRARRATHAARLTTNRPPPGRSAKYLISRITDPARRLPSDDRVLVVVVLGTHPERPQSGGGGGPMTLYAMAVAVQGREAETECLAEIRRLEGRLCSEIRSRGRHLLASVLAAEHGHHASSAR